MADGHSIVSGWSDGKVCGGEEKKEGCEGRRAEDGNSIVSGWSDGKVRRRGERKGKEKRRQEVRAKRRRQGLEKRDGGRFEQREGGRDSSSRPFLRMNRIEIAGCCRFLSGGLMRQALRSGHPLVAFQHQIKV